MPQCLGLTDSGLASLLAQGWSQVSGPYDTLDECNANCGSSSSSSSSGVSVSCCGSPVSSTLHATVTNPTGECPCVGSSVITISYNGTLWTGSGPLGSCGPTITVTLSCSSGIWTLGYTTSTGCSSGSLNPTGSCNPMNLTGNFAGSSACCGGFFPATYRIIVTN